MPRRCTICGHPDRVTIEVALAGGTSLRTMAARWSVSKTALLRHRETHLAPALGLPPPAAALGLVPLCASRAVAEALDALQHALQANPHFYRDMELAMLKVQRTQPGPLTDVLAAWVGHKA